MSIFPLGGGNPYSAALGGIRIPAIGMRASVNMFFDRAAVQNALSDMEWKSLSKASMRIKDHAKRSIKKMGRARPLLKIQKANPGLDLTSILKQPGVAGRTKRAVIQRIREIKMKPPSAPGTPPHTHVPYGHMLGFRRNLWNFYDATSHSAVVGPSRKGRMLPYLHEFGGQQTMVTWVYKPKWAGSMKAPIVWKREASERPRDPSRWLVTQQRQTVTYPARPYMDPALMKAVRNGDLAKAFGGKFSAAQAGRGVFVRG